MACCDRRLNCDAGSRFAPIVGCRVAARPGRMLRVTHTLLRDRASEPRETRHHIRRRPSGAMRCRIEIGANMSTKRIYRGLPTIVLFVVAALDPVPRRQHLRLTSRRRPGIPRAGTSARPAPSAQAPPRRGDERAERHRVHLVSRLFHRGRDGFEADGAHVRARADQRVRRALREREVAALEACLEVRRRPRSRCARTLSTRPRASIVVAHRDFAKALDRDLAAGR